MNALAGLYTALQILYTRPPSKSFPQKMYPRKSNQEVSLDLFLATLFHASVVLVLDAGCAANWLQMP